MRDYFLKTCEELDSIVFNGDSLYLEEEKESLKKYLERWNNAVKEHELIENEEKQLQDQEKQLQKDNPLGKLLRDMDDDFVNLARGSTIEELSIAREVVRRIAFMSGYGKNPEMCLCSNKVVGKINKIMEENND